MTQRAYNFNAGPSALPQEVLENAQQQLVNFRDSGMSIMEMSHRSAIFDEVHNEAITLLKKLYAIPENYEVLFLQGGASLQFTMVPMNFLTTEQKASYVLSGSWSEKAFKEAKLFGTPVEAASTKENQYRNIPALEDIQFNEDDAYVHITSNNTIYGTQWKNYPDTGNVPLVADMSSDILSKPVDIEKFGIIYAGAQKNLGPSGVTVVIIRKDLLEKANKNIPTMLKYTTHADSNSLYNTPPTFGIYMLGEVLKWVEAKGGVTEIEKHNELKAKVIYDAIDNSNGFYKGHATPESRSLMNITFRVADEELEKLFLVEAKAAGFVGLNGHRSVGGCRASTYNAVPLEACEALRDFMVDFQQKHQ
ncbi:3-phosphoserine/phosphohydroxythreonine transaminase [Lysinibacillus sp. OL1_EC]|uniref:3-phosphoserine/phosphohydroxythreonine transaminase n=1 Tax=unclassified Lysinibacillus TaxID=2636778 RepID=UPI00103EAF38|nr:MULTISPECIES: 3-phosphoserine/phosphohydroxythreonine transaminase [unclassified Lysinibacillus]MCM0624239.1 3-phosphoserine/phosphohydroxythreonine transaminase [Lysinibacillus sp. OL1_EC]MCS5500597.1 3-phosphoserine/phosphohydroxythreonine transaminase [Lysinibacillus sp. A4]TBV88485.1 3-phosphoserine/phosphohydroxythreonine transaminase [Lysinibacillus sp. OL1]UKJ44016.1 3-phosphoserine/phosphohydroxythreonine transaminase [Lysinibacillus sp. ACHW1.5]WGT37385.1 3-phosphoserine/phosphohyd